MTNKKKLKVIEEAFNYYHDRNSLTTKDEKELLNLVNELYAAISVTHCCTELKVKKEMTFEGYLIYKNILKYNGKYFLKGREVDEFSIKFMYNELVN